METDWERKDRRIAWMNINTACSQIIAARIQAGLYKPKDTREAMKELLAAIGIEFEGFLTIGSGDGTTHGGEERTTPTPVSVEQSGGGNWFCGCGKPVSQKVKDFSEDKWGEIMCFDCQKKRRAMDERIEGATGPKDVMT